MAKPTIQDIFTAAPAYGGRPSLVLDETLKIMEEYLPDVLTKVNTDHNLKIPLPQGFVFAGAEPRDKFPVVTVGISTSTSEIGIRVDEDWVNVVVSYVYDNINSERQLMDALEACDWIRKIIMKFRIGHVNDDGQRVWKTLRPSGIVGISKQRGNYEGYGFSFSAWQPGGYGYWQAVP